MQLSQIHAPEPWRTATADAVEGGGPVMVLGDVDTGKSTLVRYLLGAFIEDRGTAALLDGDVGQAMVGPSGLVGLTLVGNVDTLDERPGADRSWFVGATSPCGRLPQMLLGHSQLIELARDADIPVVVNTSGLMQGGEAKALHLMVVDAIRVKAVIGIQEGAEIEHLLTPLERRGVTVHRVSPSPRVKPKPTTFRAQLRAERFQSYFASGTTHKLALDEYAVEGATLGAPTPLDDGERAEIEKGLDSFVIEGQAAGRGAALVLGTAPHDDAAAAVEGALGRKGLHVIEAPATNGLLTGLLGSDGECVGLGLLDGWEGDGVVSIFTPLDQAQLTAVRRLHLGRIRLGHAGEDFGHWSGETVLTAESG